MTLEQLLDVIIQTLRNKGGGAAGIVQPCSCILGINFTGELPPSVVAKVRIAEVELARDVATSTAKAYEAVLHALKEPHA